MHYRPILLGVALATVSTMAFAQQPAPNPTPPPASATASSPAASSQAFDPKVARRITPEEVKKRMDAGQHVTIIDTRGKFVGPKVKGAEHVGAADLEGWAANHPKDTLIVAYCT